MPPKRTTVERAYAQWIVSFDEGLVTDPKTRPRKRKDRVEQAYRDFFAIPRLRDVIAPAKNPKESTPILGN